VRDLKVHYPIKKGVFKRVIGHVKAVDGVTIDVHAGETVALVGESGSGKTTMGKGILRLLQTTDGEVLYEGEDLSLLGAAALRKNVQRYRLYFRTLTHQ
jgi:peptide/nickel transport system ATP-binding protein